MVKEASSNLYSHLGWIFFSNISTGTTSVWRGTSEGSERTRVRAPKTSSTLSLSYCSHEASRSGTGGMQWIIRGKDRLSTSSNS